MQTQPKPNSRRQVPYVVQSLGKQIISGDYDSGDTLPIEPELAAILGVGRNALREAVKVLAGKGLLSTAPRSGTKVRPREDWNMLDPDVLSWYASCKINSPKFILDLTEMRRIIEPEAAELAAMRAERHDISQIMSAYESMEKSVKENNFEDYMAADIDFHDAILMATHNAVLANMRNAITAFLKINFSVAAHHPSAASDNLERHRKIAWAIAASDAKKARTVTLELLDQNRTIIEDEIAKQPED